MSVESALAKLKTNGLNGVNSWFPLRESSTTQMTIWFNARKNSKTAVFLQSAINHAVCQNCGLCPGVQRDGYDQLSATITNSEPLTPNGWREKFAQLPCKPTLVK
jgi:hypothetical protein